MRNRVDINKIINSMKRQVYRSGIYQYIQCRVLSTEPFDDDIPGWSLYEDPNECSGSEKVYKSIYRTATASITDFFRFVRERSEQGYKVISMIQELPPCISPNNPEAGRVTRKREHFASGKAGKIIRTKYEYPDDCRTPRERSRYRSKMRRQRAKGENG